jgi:hypothetical protein
MNKLAFIIFIFAFVSLTKAQDLESEFLHFYSYNFDYKLNTKVHFKAGELFTFKRDSYELQYTLFKLGATYRFSKRITTEFLYKPMLFKGSTGDIWYQRLSTSLIYRSTLFSLPLKNTITAEWYSPLFKKYRYRFIYTIKLSFKNNFLPLRATPYIKYQLYYYLGGKPLNYWDENGEILLARNAPNDFHRYRVGAGVRFRPAKHFYITIYYIWQEEFNTTFTNYRQLNILNKSQTAIKYAFNDYQVLGLSLTYYLTKKRKKK